MLCPQIYQNCGSPVKSQFVLAGEREITLYWLDIAGLREDQVIAAITAPPTPHMVPVDGVSPETLFYSMTASYQAVAK